jgi:hypothetical protein
MHVESGRAFEGSLILFHPWRHEATAVGTTANQKRVCTDHYHLKLDTGNVTAAPPPRASRVDVGILGSYTNVQTGLLFDH